MPNIETADVKNYYIGKGILEFKRHGEPDYIDMGNATAFEITPELEKLDHFSNRRGVKQKDRTVIVSKKATVKVTLEEWTPRNVALALLGKLGVDAQGRDEVEIFGENAIGGSLRFTGTNEVGPKWQIVLPEVEFSPSAAVSPITDEWGALELSGDVSAVDGKFGTATKIADEGEHVSA